MEVKSRLPVRLQRMIMSLVSGRDVVQLWKAHMYRLSSAAPLVRIFREYEGTPDDLWPVYRRLVFKEENVAALAEATGRGEPCLWRHGVIPRQCKLAGKLLASRPVTATVHHVVPLV